MQTILKQSPHLIYAHSKAGENLWHFAAQGGNIEVSRICCCAMSTTPYARPACAGRIAADIVLAAAAAADA